MTAPNSLSKNERRILLSFLLFIVAWPIFSTFTNTFLWRTSGSPVDIAVYNVGMYVGVPLGFFINSGLLHRFGHKKLFFAGCLLQGIAPLLLTVIAPTSMFAIAAFGLFLGLPMGLYWGNRNLITLCATERCDRLRFLSVEATQNTVAGIVAPLLIGHYLAAMSGGIAWAYVTLMLIGFVVLVVAGALMQAADVEVPHNRASPRWIGDASALWKRQRWFEFLSGAMTVNESTVSLLIILTFLGLEDAVGSTKSGVAILTAVMMALIGRRIPESRYRSVLWLAFVLIGGSAAAFAWRFDGPASVSFFVAIGLIAAFRTTTTMALMYKVVGHEAERTDRNRFLYLFDREVCLNAGRVAMLALLMLAFSFAPLPTLRYGLVAAAAVHLPLIWLMGKIQDGIRSNRTGAP
ncbi:MFS transporter [bacterium]|nr:MFS transporter [bacterium]